LPQEKRVDFPSEKITLRLALALLLKAQTMPARAPDAFLCGKPEN